jgi:hypothetical protein
MLKLDELRIKWWPVFERVIRPVIMVWLFILMVYSTYLLAAIQDPALIGVKIAVFGIAVAAFVNFIGLFFGWRTEERIKEILEILKAR